MIERQLGGATNLRTRSFIEPYLFVLPALALTTAIVFYPLVQVIMYSVSDWNLLDYRVSGSLRNFWTLFHDPQIFGIIANNLKILLNVPVQIAVAVIIASLLYAQYAGWRVYEVVYFIPAILPITVVGILWSFIYRFDGPINSLLRLLGLGALAHLWLGNTTLSLPSTVVVIIWKNVGFVILLFLARLLSSPPEIFEAARIDGANDLQMTIHITIPELYEIINIYLVLGIIWSFTDTFSYVYVMTMGGPGYSSTVVEYYIYQKAFFAFQIGYASALSVVVLMVISSLVLVYLRIAGSKREQ